jgi:hypothetical protein
MWPKFNKPRKSDIIIITLIIIVTVPIIMVLVGVKVHPVISNSMSHFQLSMTHPDYGKTFSELRYELWASKGYAKSDVERFTAPGGFEMGDLLIAVPAQEFSPGDIVVYEMYEGMVMTHRLLEDNGSTMALVPDLLYDTDLIDWVERDKVKGKVIFVIPKLGTFHLFLGCMQNSKCDLLCFFDRDCMRSSFS